MEGTVRLVRAAFNHVVTTDWASVLNLLAALWAVGVAGTVGWVLLAGVSSSLIASPLLIAAVLTVLTGCFSLTQWLLRCYATGREDHDLLSGYTSRLGAAWTLYLFLFSIGAVFFVVPGVYVSSRLAPYLPRVARGHDVFRTVTDVWLKTEDYVSPILTQGLVYYWFGVFVALFIASVPSVVVWSVLGTSGFAGFVTGSLVFGFCLLGYAAFAVTLASFHVGVDDVLQKIA